MCCSKLTAAKFMSPLPISTWACGEVSKPRWKRKARPRCRRDVSSILCASCPPAKSRSTSMEKMRRPFAADKASSRFLDYRRRNFRRSRNLKTPRSLRSGKRICATVYAKPPTPSRLMKRATCSTASCSVSKKTNSPSWPPMDGGWPCSTSSWNFRAVTKRTSSFRRRRSRSCSAC